MTGREGVPILSRAASPLRDDTGCNCRKDAPPVPKSAAGRTGSNQSACGSRASPRCRAKRSEEHTSELQSLMRISYAVFCLKKKTNRIRQEIIQLSKYRN